MIRNETFDRVAPEALAHRPLTTILDQVRDMAEGETLSVGDLFQALGAASYTPLMILPALAVVSPLSGIPGFSSLCGLTIAVFAAQMIVRRHHVWAPGWLLRRQMRADRARRALAWLRRPAGWIERAARPRIQWLVTPPLDMVPQFLCLVAGLAMPFLELVPFSSSLLGASVILLSVAMLVRDGLLALVGMAPFAAAAGIIAAVL